MSIDSKVVEQTLITARRRLLAARTAAGHWKGELSSSALSTATASCALALLDRGHRSEQLSGLVRRGLAWLAGHQNSDGGWGDTIGSPSNISTTALCWAAIGAGEHPGEKCQGAAQRAEDWLKGHTGDLTPRSLARAIGTVYGNDRTFSTPILTMCALAGRFGEGRRAWRWLPVVSYALPALIAIGQVRHHHRPTRNPFTRCLRFLTRDRTLRVLESIQPESGGFLEAAPLTSFVVMSLVSTGRSDHPVVRRGCEFLLASVRDDGSWPIDTNLATWVTTLSVNALTSGEDAATYLSVDERAAVQAWLIDQRYRREHPYTRAAPGGWAWTDLSGGVPDADDTAGALLALWHLTIKDESNIILKEDVRCAAVNGVHWLLDLQNHDGGIPTFCRGWGRMPFDRSSPDLTAHALRAWHTWDDTLSYETRRRTRRAIRKAVSYLLRAQREDGTWIPLWFGNQESPRQENPLYGTTRVLRAGEIIALDGKLGNAWLRARQRGIDWLLSAQNDDGGWGGATSVPSSIEETALAVEALASTLENGMLEGTTRKVHDSIERGCAWLVEHTDAGTRFDPAPIGLYFAKLWYFERLYPLIFTVAALDRVCRIVSESGAATPRNQSALHQR
jgi:squalene-hopene/tetraprenyl-beta-curcumene cyclase